ncbi:hypothetical protein NDU88_002395 [Pleurodeles waltl]|uniref:Uncharacterized protein n=1 Tax=Pleurodeles waltl TaxID=8319 RepID=A0AAV7MRI4_PLEWA|nr:hypothetical protein NDU88_002395 [Pleurodeles waltl]
MDGGRGLSRKRASSLGSHSIGGSDTRRSHLVRAARQVPNTHMKQSRTHSTPRAYNDLAAGRQGVKPDEPPQWAAQPWAIVPLITSLLCCRK